MAEVGIHHVGKGRIPFALSIHHYAEQAATPLILVAIEHLQGKEVVGRGCNVGVEDDKRHARSFCHSTYRASIEPTGALEIGMRNQAGSEAQAIGIIGDKKALRRPIVAFMPIVHQF